MSDRQEGDDAHPRKRRKASVEGESHEDTPAAENTAHTILTAPMDIRSVQNSEDNLSMHILKSFSSRSELWGECGKLMESTDWSKTSLGPRATWPPVYERGLNVVLSNRFPTIYYLGPEFVFLYNDGYIPLLGSRHPTCFGKTLKEVNLFQHYL